VVLANLEIHIFEKELSNLDKLFNRYIILSGIYKQEEQIIKYMLKNLNLKNPKTKLQKTIGMDLW